MVCGSVKPLAVVLRCVIILAIPPDDSSSNATVRNVNRLSTSCDPSSVYIFENDISTPTDIPSFALAALRTSTLRGEARLLLKNAGF